MTNFGKWLKAERKKQGLSQWQLANMCGMDHSMISHYENTKRYPRLDSYYKLLKALGYRIEIKEIEDGNKSNA